MKWYLSEDGYRDENGISFRGVIPRDLPVGDQYELRSEGSSVQTFEITQRLNRDGVLIIKSAKVG